MKHKILSLLFLLITTLSSAQHHVDHSTGTMQFHIPLLKVNANGGAYDVSMTYKSKALHRDDSFSPTGLGWQGNFVPGYISREVRGGFPDEKVYNGFFYTDTDVTSREYANGNKDSQSDLFYLNLYDESVPFYLRSVSGQLVVNFLKPTNLKVECQYSGGQIVGWIVHDTEGTVYDFSTNEVMLARDDNRRLSTLQDVRTRWEVKSIRRHKKEPIRLYHWNNGTYFSFSTSSFQKSYPNGKYMLGYENHTTYHTLLDKINDYETLVHNFDMEDFRSDLLTLLKRQKVVENQYKSMISIANSFDGTWLDQFTSNFKSDMAQLDEQVQALENSYFSYHLGINNAFYNLKQAMVAAGSVSPIRKSYDFNYFFSRSVSKRDLITRVNYHEDENIYFEYDSISTNKAYSKRLKRIVYDNVDSKRFIYFTYKGNHDILKQITVLGSDNESIIDKYDFEYYHENDNGVLAFRSKALLGQNKHEFDYWGFYNAGDTVVPGIYNSNLFMPVNRYDIWFALFPTYNPKRVTEALKSGGEAYVYSPDYYQEDKFSTSLSPDYIASDPERPDPWSLLPNSQLAKALTLKSVRSQYGGITEFDYESNEVYLPDIDSTLVTGGVRIKSISVRGVDSTLVAKKVFQYRFPNAENKMHSTGVFEEWGKWHNMETFHNSTYEDALFYSGSLLFDNSNSGIFYHYTEESNLDGSITGYKYPNISGDYASTNRMGPSKYTGSIGNLLLAKIVYDSSHRVKYIERYGYDVYNNQISPNRIGELAILNASFPHVNIKPTGLLDSITQYDRIFREFHDSELIETIIGRFNTTETSYALATGEVVKFNWADVYDRNNSYLGRSTDSLSVDDMHFVSTHALVNYSYQPRLVRVERTDFEIQSMPSLSHSTRPYYFVDILASNIERIQSDRSIIYQSVSSPNIREIRSSQSVSDNTVVERFKYLDDYNNNFTEQSLEALKALNFRGSPLERSNLLRREGNVDKLLGSELSLYNAEGQLNHLLKWRNTGAPFVESSLTSEGVLMYDNNYDTVATYSKYDDKGNLIEHEINGKKSTTIYGYHKRYPILRFDNIGYEELKTYIPEAQMEALSSHIEPSINIISGAIANVPSRISFTSNLYNHDKAIKVVTDENKRSTLYRYDEVGKLTNIIDDENNILKTFSYNTAKTNQFSSYGNGNTFPRQGLRKVYLVSNIYWMPFLRDTCTVQVISETGRILDEISLHLRSVDDLVSRQDHDSGPERYGLSNQFVRFYDNKVKFRFILSLNTGIDRPPFFTSYNSSLFPSGPGNIQAYFTTQDDGFYLDTDYFEVPPYADTFMSNISTSVIYLNHVPVF